MGKEEVNEVRLGENYQRLLTVEKALDSYFDKYLAPVVDECYEYQEEQRKGEFKERSSAPQLAFMPPAAAMQYAMGGNWCSRHTEDLVEDVMSRLGRDEVMSSDLSHLGKEWRRGMLGMLDASGNHSQANRLVVQDALGNRNFSDAYIRSRITGRIVDRLAAKGVPKDSLDYVVRYGFGDNVATFLFDVHGKSRMDKRVVELSEKKYDPTVLETVAAMGASFLADTAITGGMAAGGAAARTVAGVRTGVRTVKGFKVMEMGVSEAEKKAARYVGRIANAFGVGEVSLQTGALFSGDTASATQEVSRLVLGDAESLEQFRADASQVALNEDNSCFADIEKGLHNSVYHKGAGFRFYGMDTFMRHKYETVSRKPEEYYDMDVVNEDEAPGATVIPSFDYSSPDVFNGTQAEVMRQDNDTVIPMRPGLSPQSYSVSQDGHESHADAGEQVRDVSAKETAGDEVIPVVEPVAKESVGEQPVPKEAAPAVGKKKDEALLSWGGLLDGIGLGGLSSVGKNLGHVISMLPDLVISMFNGKSKNLKLSNNLLPLTLLIMALFFTKKNPFLKLLLLGFAGINLLDKACRETNDIESNRASKVSYRRYQDQALDSRITGVRLSGGVLVMDIDGRPFAQSLDPRVLEAHERGLLPLNVICNELLAKYDAKMESVAESYERQVARGEEEGRPLALK